MADNSSIGYVGDNYPSQSHDSGQQALQEANFRAQQDAARAGERANKAAARSNSAGTQGSATVKAVFRKGR